MFKNRKTPASFIAALLIVCLLLSFGACSSGGSGPARNDTGAPAGGAGFGESAPASAAPVPVAPTDNEDGAYDSAAQETEAVSGSAAASGYDYANASGSVTDGRKITFSASYSINTKTYDADYTKINDLIIQTGGYVSREETSDYTQYGRNEGRYTYLAAHIPAKGYDSFLGRLSEVGEVINKNKSSQDMTTEYYDTEARIEMLNIRKERLMGYLVEAKKAEDIVEFERELSDVLYELDQYQGNKRHMDQLVEFATVDISLTELITPETIGKDGEPLGDRASDAFALSSGNVGAFLEDAAVFFAAAAPVIFLLVVIGAIIWVVVWLIRKLLRKARARREAKKPPVPQPAYGTYQHYSAPVSAPNSVHESDPDRSPASNQNPDLESNQ